MSFFPIPIPGFSGLNLVDDPGDIGFGGAIDMLDVDLDHPGVLRSRDKFSQYATTTLTSPSVAAWGGSYIVSTAAAVKLYTGSSLTGTAVAPNQYFNWSVQPFGTATTSYLYMADDGLANATRRLTTAGVISAPAGMPTCRFLSRTPADNRLVAGYIASNPHRVQFSDAGDAETWGANNYIDLDPGDGEQITGMGVYRDQLFVFKQSKFFVFYGTSTDSTGNPIFNYRAVRNGIGGAGITCTAPDGIYFYGLGPMGIGVFRTTGGDAEEVSHPIRPALNGLNVPSTFTPGTLTTVTDLCFGYGRVHLAVSGTNNYILSFDPQNQGWTVTQVPSGVTYMTGVRTNFLVVAGTGANATIHYLNPANASSDSLRTPTPLYRSGFESLAPPRRYIDKYGFGPSRKRIRSWRVKGTGTVTMAVAADYGATVGATALTLGTSPAVAEARYSRAIRGAKISYKLSGSGPWSVNEMVAFLADTRGIAEDVSGDV